MMCFGARGLIFPFLSMSQECGEVQLLCNVCKVLIICLHKANGIILHTTEITAVVEGSVNVISLLVGNEFCDIIDNMF